MIWLIGTVLCAVFLLLDLAWRWRVAHGAGMPAGPRAGLGVRPPPPAAAAPQWLRDYARALLPIFALLFTLHHFVLEPFKISAVSMVPNLEPGDVMLVHKWAYGIRMPLSNRLLVPVQSPQRGDVMAFFSPLDFEAGKVYVKRVVGLPGDRVAYRGRVVLVNGVAHERTPLAGLHHEGTGDDYRAFEERTGERLHRSLLFRDDPALRGPPVRFHHPHESLCSVHGHDVECVVPEGHYFVMGDNRDRSLDSRAWGFVPDRLVVGRAFFVAWSGLSFDRTGWLR